MIYATIMAGGAGTRFWPASRKLTPKQLLNLAGDRSMIQSTVDRLGDMCPPENVLVVTNEVLVDSIRQQLPGVPAQSIIGEPAKRDTAPCVGLAAAWVMSMAPEGIMAVMPADHVITPDSVFQQSLDHAAKLVAEDDTRIVTFGIKPTYPAEVFGYIERSKELSGEELPTFEVAKFREKPDTDTAKQFLDAGTFYWNSGIFVWKAKTIFGALEKHEPEMAAHLKTIQESIGTSSFTETLQKEFTAIKGKSIDYAVMERYENVKVIEAPFQWDDLGNWTAIPRQRGVDENGNTVDAKHLGINAKNNIVRSDDDHLIVTVGMQDCIVVRTPDATLVANRNDESAIKEVVKQLEELGWSEYL
jgi:mannose-1-phosphate guanylyltransferase